MWRGRGWTRKIYKNRMCLSWLVVFSGVSKCPMWLENKDYFFFFEVLLVVFGELINIWGPLVYSFFWDADVLVSPPAGCLGLFLKQMDGSALSNNPYLVCGHAVLRSSVSGVHLPLNWALLFTMIRVTSGNLLYFKFLKWESHANPLSPLNCCGHIEICLSAYLKLLSLDCSWSMSTCHFSIGAGTQSTPWKVVSTECVFFLKYNLPLLLKFLFLFNALAYVSFKKGYVICGRKCCLLRMGTKAMNFRKK